MPKSAYSAMSQADVVAADIIADLSGKPRPPGKYRNTCWSMLAPDNSAKIGGDYVPGKKDGKAILEVKDEFISKPDDSADFVARRIRRAPTGIERSSPTFSARNRRRPATRFPQSLSFRSRSIWRVAGMAMFGRLATPHKRDLNTFGYPRTRSLESDVASLR